MIPVNFERMIFNAAGEHLKGYAHGMWEAAEFDGIVFYIPPPQSEPVSLDCPGSQRTVKTDRITAGAAMSMIAINHMSWAFHVAADKAAAGSVQAHRATQAARALADLYHQMRNAFFADESPFDHDALFTYID